MQSSRVKRSCRNIVRMQLGVIWVMESRIASANCQQPCVVQIDDVCRSPLIGRSRAGIRCSGLIAPIASVLLGLSSIQVLGQEAPPFPGRAPGIDHSKMEQRPLPGAVGTRSGGIGMGKGRVGRDTGPIPDSLIREYLNEGRYAKLERLFRDRLEHLERTASLKDPRVATTLKNLGLVYQLQARWGEAAQLYERALEIRRQINGRYAPRIALAASQLATVYQAQGRFEDAERLHKEAVRIFERAHGPNHLDVGLGLNNLARLYLSQQKFGPARELFNNALGIFERVRGPIHSDVALARTNLALSDQLERKYQSARRHFVRAVEIFRELGEDRPDLAVAHHNLAGLLVEQGRWGAALNEAGEATQIVVRQIKRGIVSRKTNLGAISPAKAPWNQATFARYIKAAWEFRRTAPNSSEGLEDRSFRFAQWMAQTSTANALAQMAARQTSEDRQLANMVRARQDLVVEWRRLDQELLAAASGKPEQRNAIREKVVRKRLAEIDTQLISIDRDLQHMFPDYASLANPVPLTLAETQTHLKPDEALMLILDTYEALGATGDTFIWVVTRSSSRWVVASFAGQPTHKDPNVHILRDHVDALRCGLDFDGSWVGTRCFDLLNVVYSKQDRWSGKPLPFQLGRAHQLYKSLFGQVEDLIKGKKLLIVPSGPLTQLPFQVLVTEQPETTQITRSAFNEASWLAKKHALAVLPSVSSLGALRAHAKTSSASAPFVGFGNPLLDGNAQDQWQRAAAELARSIKGCATTKPNSHRSASCCPKGYYASAQSSGAGGPSTNPCCGSIAGNRRRGMRRRAHGGREQG